MKNKTTTINHPIPPFALEEFRRRKRERGISIKRSVEDALRYALSDENKKIWF